MKMNDNEIIKALKCCAESGHCAEHCPLDDPNDDIQECTSILSAAALDLINRQNAEIEKLKQDIRHFSFEKTQSQLAPGWLYASIGDPIWDNKFKAVEKALGFRLLRWQKYFIAYGMMRCYGRTTAEILRELLLVNEPPIDFTKRYVNRRESIYRSELLELKNKLDTQGIPTRKVAKTEKQRRECMLEYECTKGDLE